jgi:hypothetical protein
MVAMKGDVQHPWWPWMRPRGVGLNIKAKSISMLGSMSIAKPVILGRKKTRRGKLQHPWPPWMPPTKVELTIRAHTH